MNVVVLVGGVGGAKLAYGLSRVLPPEALTIIVNTGDDFWLHGLRICPDLDTIMYTLSGLVDPLNGWGLKGDTFHTLEALKRYGEDAWFRLGDQDMATHILRTRRLQGGHRLTEVTQDFTKKLGISQAILPMTDSSLATIVETVEYGELDFQTYFVKHRWQPVVKALRLEGIEKAVMTNEVEQALTQAEVILIGPSNPWLSIDPILKVPGIRDLMIENQIPRVAISPIVGGSAVKGPAAKMMLELGYEQSAKAVAEYYGDLINGFVYDQIDAHLDIPVMHHVTYQTIMNSDDDKVSLAGRVVEWIKSWM